MIPINVLRLNVFTKIGDAFESGWDSFTGSIEKALNSLVDQIIEALLDWIFTLIYGLLAGILKIVEFISEFFDVFAGTSRVIYKNESDFLINIFFSNEGITNVFWAMALIAMVLAFGFAIFAISRSITDVTGTAKQTVGQVMSQFFRCLITLLLLNMMVVASVNISNVLLDRINFAMMNAENLDEDPDGRTFSEQEYATMTKIMATIGNYCVNESADNRYNLNSCFNAIRGDLQALQASGLFDYTYERGSNGHHTWQSALQNLVNAADLTRDLSLDVYNTNVASAILMIADELESNSAFRPVERVEVSVLKGGSVQTDDLIFLIVGMNSANNTAYNDGNLNDALRAPYINGEKSYLDVNQVKRDFNIRTMDYFVGFISSIVFIVIMALCIFTFIVRMFNILLLYITAPLFISSMPLDEGNKFQSWLQAFVVQLFSGFGHVIAMRLYLIIVPAAMGDDLVFFPGEGLWFRTLNWFARLLMLLGGAWAVLKAGGLISSILSGNPAGHTLQQEGIMGQKVSAGAKQASAGGAKMAAGGAKMAGVGALKVAGAALGALRDTGSIVKELGGAAASSAKSYSRSNRSGKSGTSDKQSNKESAAAGSDKQGTGSFGQSAMSSDKAAQTAYPSSQSLGKTPPGREPPLNPKQLEEVRRKWANVKVPDYPKPPPAEPWDLEHSPKSDKNN